MRSRREPPQLAARAAAARADGAAGPEGSTAPDDSTGLRVDDHLEPRVRIATDVVGASRFASEQLPGPLLGILSFAVRAGFLILPIMLAVRLCTVRQFRRLTEAIVAGGVTVGIVALANLLLDQRASNPVALCALHSTGAAACLLDRLRF